MSERSEYDEQYDYRKLLRRREWRAKSAEMTAKSPRCEKCGRTGRRFAVHHRWYEYGRLPWDYPDEAYMVVCKGRCHREADGTERSRKQMPKTTSASAGNTSWVRSCSARGKRNSGNWPKYEREFKAWLIRKGIPPEGWDWNNQMWPPWSFWNEFSDEFLAERRSDDAQGRLAL